MPDAPWYVSTGRRFLYMLLIMQSPAKCVGYKHEKGEPEAHLFRDSHRIQTCNLLIRSQMLYSVELANHCF